MDLMNLAEITFTEGLGFLKSPRRKGKRLSCKNGGVVYKGGGFL